MTFSNDNFQHMIEGKQSNEEEVIKSANNFLFFDYVHYIVSSIIIHRPLTVSWNSVYQERYIDQICMLNQFCESETNTE